MGVDWVGTPVLVKVPVPDGPPGAPVPDGEPVPVGAGVVGAGELSVGEAVGASLVEGSDGLEEDCSTGGMETGAPASEHCLTTALETSISVG